MKKNIILMFILFFTTLLIKGERIEKNEIIYNPEDFIDRRLEKQIKIGLNVSFNVLIDVNKRMFGGLSIANLELGYIDGYCDPIMVQNDFLDLDFIDINNDRYRDIIVSGSILYYHDKGEVVLFQEPVIFIYIFNKQDKKFYLRYHNASFKPLGKHSEIIDGSPWFETTEEITPVIIKLRQQAKKEHKNLYRIERSEVKSLNTYEAPEFLNKKIIIGKELVFNSKIQVFNWGRSGGVLSIANLNLCIYNDGYLGTKYDNDVLEIDFFDYDSDGYRDIIASGMLIYYDDKGKDIIYREPVVFIYRYFPKDKKFKLVYRNASFDLQKSGIQYGLNTTKNTAIIVKKLRKQAQLENEAKDKLSIK